MSPSIRQYLEKGPATSKNIQAATGLRQSSVARQLKEMGDKVIQLRQGRSIKYAVTRDAFGVNDKIPLSTVDAHGHISLLAYIRPLGHGGFFVEPVSTISPLLLGENGNGLYDDLPYFLFDVRPQGFLGRQIARRLALQSENFPSDPRYWATNHIGRYLISNGDDLPGNFIFGEQALLRVRHRPAQVTKKDYPALADRVMKGELIGSSAGGEQPKFTAFNGDLSSHVIVKFSPKSENEIAARWRDVLITEYHAAEMINSNIFAATAARLFEMDNRLFLETQRFDRIGEAGRSSMISLQAIDAEYIGSAGSWPKVMKRLFDIGLVSEQDVIAAESVWHFGRLINNTDMHLGNLSLAMEDDSFRLLPIYDMCSMGFAPQSGGEIQPFNCKAPGIREPDINEEQLANARRISHDFWENVVNDDRISSQFKNYLQKGNPIIR
jgi:hypothetical protein